MARLHALIAGVSAYPHLPEGDGSPGPDDYGMRQLTACASSAAAIAQWLEHAGRRLAAPLGSVRLLLSPSPEELRRDPRLAGAEPVTRENLRRAAVDWRHECENDPDDIAFFYFAGHGLQRTRSDAVLLTSDFGDAGGNPLFNAVDVNNLFGGMAPTANRAQMARTQLWFIDACRGYPSAFDNFETLGASEVFAVELSDSDERCAPIYFGAVPGGSAYSIAGERTLFSRALLESLDRCGGQLLEGRNRWVVTAGSLLRGMKATIDRLNAEEGCDQRVWDGGQMEDPERRIVDLAGVPEVDVRLELVPTAGGVSLSFHDSSGQPMLVADPLDPNPYRCRWKAGSYRLRTTPRLTDIDPEVPVRPPSFDWQATVP